MNDGFYVADDSARLLGGGPYSAPPFGIGTGVGTSVGTGGVVDDWEITVEDPCEEEHVLEQIAQYPDGVWGSCKECGERVKLPTVPGGYTAIQIRGFLERVLAGTESEADGELLVELASLEAVLDMESDELELAKKRVEIAKEVLLRRADVR